MAGKFDLKKTSNGKFMFNLKAGNGRVILTSEVYRTKAGAHIGIESVKKNAANDARYVRSESKKGDLIFNLKAGNGQVIGKSEMYSSALGMEVGIESVKNNGPTAEIVDNT